MFINNRLRNSASPAKLATHAKTVEASLTVFRNDCPDSIVGQSIAAIAATQCHWRSLGKASVIEKINDHYVILRVPKLTKEGDLVEVVHDK